MSSPNRSTHGAVNDHQRILTTKWKHLLIVALAAAALIAGQAVPALADSVTTDTFSVTEQQQTQLTWSAHGTLQYQKDAFSGGPGVIQWTLEECMVYLSRDEETYEGEDVYWRAAVVYVSTGHIWESSAQGDMQFDTLNGDSGDNKPYWPTTDPEPYETNNMANQVYFKVQSGPSMGDLGVRFKWM